MTEKNRTEAFSDGVFAIAITLLILEIKVPHAVEGLSDRELARRLIALWPSFLAFAVSFATILVMWVSHHGLMNLFRAIDRRFLFANGLLLAVVTFIPFPTALLAEHLRGDGARTAAATYCGTFLVASIAFLATLYTGTAAHLLKPDLPAGTIPRVKRAYWSGFAAYAAATAVSFVHAASGVVLCSVLWVVWATLRYADRRAVDPEPIASGG